MNAGKTQVFFFFSFTHRIREVRFHTPLRNKGLFFFFASSKMLQCAEIEVSKNCMRSQVIHSHSQHDYAVEGTFEHVTFFNACNGAVELTVTMGTNRRKTTRKWVQLTQVRKHIPSSEKSTFFLFLSLGKSNSIKQFLVLRRKHFPWFRLMFVAASSLALHTWMPHCWALSL